jgi:hypothetical protein
LGAVDDPRNRGINLWLYLAILSLQIQKRYQVVVLSGPPDPD